MQYLLQLFQQNRKNIISILEAHNLEQVNAIPSGFNNNLIWHAGHLLVGQQALIYMFSGLAPQVPLEDWFPKYGTGSAPDGNATQEDLDQIIDFLKTTSTKTVEDYHAGAFKTYKLYASEYFGVSMNNIEEAIHFNTFHEGVHYGWMASIQAALKEV